MAKKKAEAEPEIKEASESGVWFQVTLRLEYPKGTSVSDIEDEIEGIIDGDRVAPGEWTDSHVDSVTPE